MRLLEPLYNYLAEKQLRGNLDFLQVRAKRSEKENHQVHKSQWFLAFLQEVQLNV